MPSDKKITLPSGEAVVRQYMTAGQWIDVQNILPRERVKFLIENLVVSFDGKTENVYELIRKIRAKDYVVIENEIQRVFKEETAVEKKMAD